VNAESCARTAGKSERTREKFAAIAVRFVEIFESVDRTSANIGKTGGKALRDRSCGEIDGKSGPIREKFAAIGATFVETFATGGVTFATFGRTAEMRGGTSAGQ
jgi:hypothetical protein